MADPFLKFKEKTNLTGWVLELGVSVAVPCYACAIQLNWFVHVTIIEKCDVKCIYMGIKKMQYKSK